MKENIILLTKDNLDNLIFKFGPITFNYDFDIVYENQIPQSGIVIVEGKIQLTKNNQVIETIHSHHLLGATQLLNEKTTSYGCRILAQSKIIILGKFDLLNLCRKDFKFLFT